MKHRPLLAFLLLSLVLAWAVWLPLILATHDVIKLPFASKHIDRWQTLGAVGPCLAALIVTASTGGVSALRSLFGRFLRWRIGWHWYGIALLLPVVPLGLHLALGGHGPAFVTANLQPGQAPTDVQQVNPWSLVLPLFLRQLVANPIAEEMAWRGFLLPRLQRRYNAVIASVLAGLAVALISLPLMFAKGIASPAWSFLFLLLQVLPSFILFTWLFNHTQGSLIAVVLCNTSSAVVIQFLHAAQANPFLTIGTTCGLALIVTVAAGPRDLCRNPARKADALAEEWMPRQEQPA
jgi:membrane protease YdiL (CAAX protease family)